jgi:hypothetical protein
MIISSVSFSYEDQILTITAIGHGTEVIPCAHRIAAEILSNGYGAWRISSVDGFIEENTRLDSDMKWTITAVVKNRPKAGFTKLAGMK